MKYIHTGGPYREFRGYVFIGQNPVTITDRGTLLAIERMHDFRPYEESHALALCAGFARASSAEEEKTESTACKLRSKTGILKGKLCGKCGKAIPKGWYMHQKWCKGAKLAHSAAEPAHSA